MNMQQLANSLETSPEIIQAIAERLESPTVAAILKVWEDPKGAMDEILTAARSKTSEDLFWGVETYEGASS